MTWIYLNISSPHSLTSSRQAYQLIHCLIVLRFLFINYGLVMKWTGNCGQNSKEKHLWCLSSAQLLRQWGIQKADIMYEYNTLSVSLSSPFLSSFSCFSGFFSILFCLSLSHSFFSLFLYSPVVSFTLSLILCLSLPLCLSPLLSFSLCLCFPFSLSQSLCLSTSQFLLFTFFISFSIFLTPFTLTFYFVLAGFFHSFSLSF